MAKIAILGFGTVGSGVYEVLCRNAAGVSRRAGVRKMRMRIPVKAKIGRNGRVHSCKPGAMPSSCGCGINIFWVFVPI